jgi:Fe-S oxidoreductase
MGQKRAHMAEEAGGNVIVTACHFCLTNVEDAIKTSGLEGKLQVIDLTELAAAHLWEIGADRGEWRQSAYIPRRS